MRTLCYNQTGDKRLPFAKVVAEIIGVKPKYTGVPKCAYIIDYATITRQGNIEVDERVDSTKMERLIQKLGEKGFSLPAHERPAEHSQPAAASILPAEHSQPTESPVPQSERAQGNLSRAQPADSTQPTTAPVPQSEHAQGNLSGETNTTPEHPADANQYTEPTSSEDDNSVAEVGGTTISVPRDVFTDLGLANLQRLLWAKGELICKALDIENTDIEVTDETVTFPWFGELDADEVKYISQFISGLCEFANTSQRITSKQRREGNPKFTMRTWLVRMGFNGNDYKGLRSYMMKRLPGDAAWRFGKLEREEVAHIPAAVQ